MADKDDEFQNMLRSVSRQGLNLTAEDEKEAIPKPKKIINKPTTASQISDNSNNSEGSIEETIDSEGTTKSKVTEVAKTTKVHSEQKRQKVDKVLNIKDSNTKKTSVKKSKNTKTTVRLNRQLLHIIKYHTGEFSNKFIEREIINIMIKKFPHLKSDLETIAKL